MGDSVEMDKNGLKGSHCILPVLPNEAQWVEAGLAAEGSNPRDNAV